MTGRSALRRHRQLPRGQLLPRSWPHWAPRGPGSLRRRSLGRSVARPGGCDVSCPRDGDRLIRRQHAQVLTWSLVGDPGWGLAKSSSSSAGGTDGTPHPRPRRSQALGGEAPPLCTSGGLCPAGGPLPGSRCGSGRDMSLLTCRSGPQMLLERRNGCWLHGHRTLWAPPPGQRLRRRCSPRWRRAPGSWGARPSSARVAVARRLWPRARAGGCRGVWRRSGGHVLWEAPRRWGGGARENLSARAWGRKA